MILKGGEREIQYLHTIGAKKNHVSKNSDIFYKIDGGKIIDAGRSLKLVYGKWGQAGMALT